MTNYNPNVLIAGAGAGQGLWANPLSDPNILPEGVHPALTLYDPDPNKTLRDDLPYLRNAVAGGRARLVHTFPDEQFDIAIVATASEQHAAAVKTVLERQASTPFMVLEKPVAATSEDFAWFRTVEDRIQPASLVNEPYFFINSLREAVAQIRSHPENPLVEAFVWSSKQRRRANPHGELGIYAIELPHTHGAASWIAGQVLDVDTAQENIYFADVDGIKNNDGNYLQFETGGATFHVAQGLGKFIMDQHGHMHPVDDTPPPTRRIALRFADGSSMELDVNTAFPFDNSNGPAYSTMSYYSHDGAKPEIMRLYDNPRNSVIRHILLQAQGLAGPAPGISLSESLQRNAALLNLRNSAVVQSNTKLFGN